MVEDASTTFNSSFIPDSSKVIAARRGLIERFNKLLQYIRSLHRFQNFLQAPSESELRSLSEGGAIILFNVSDIRSDAFLITTDGIRSIRLPLSTSNSVVDFAKHFFDAISEQNLVRYRHAKSEMNHVLRGLWESAVKPILDELGFTEMPRSDEAWPRVCWIGSGLLSILPIHTSGNHDSDPPQTALDRVISSYAFTVKSLAYAGEPATRADQVLLKDKAILVAMPTTPEANSLPFVETEAMYLQNLLSNESIDTTILQNSVRTVVLSLHILSFISHVMGILRMIHLRVVSFSGTGKLNLSLFQISYH